MNIESLGICQVNVISPIYYIIMLVVPTFKVSSKSRLPKLKDFFPEDIVTKAIKRLVGVL